MPITIKWMISIQISAIVVDMSWNSCDCTVNWSMDDAAAVVAWSSSVAEEVGMLVNLMDHNSFDWLALQTDLDIDWKLNYDLMRTVFVASDAN